MKTRSFLVTLLAALTVFGFAMPTESQAYDSCHQERRIVNRLPCGKPVYAYYRIIGYDRCGRPVGRWVVDNRHCSCNTCRPPSYGHHGHHGRYHSGSCGSSRSSFFFRFGW